MDAIEALMRPVPDEERLKALARSLRGRKNAADFFAGSTVPGLQKMAQGEQGYVQDVAERQGVLREAMERRNLDKAQHEAELSQRKQEGVLNRTAALHRVLARGPLVTVNNAGEPDPGASSYHKERGKADSVALDEIYAKSEIAQELTGNLNAFASVVEGLETGSLAGVEADLGRLGASLGLEISPDADKLQAARAISNQLALLVRNPESGMGMPGSLSERDIVFLKESMPRIVNSPGGNRIILDVLGRLSQRNMERAQRATEFAERNGRFVKPDFEREWAEYNNQNALFDDLQPEAPDDGWSIEEVQ